MNEERFIQQADDMYSHARNKEKRKDNILAVSVVIVLAAIFFTLGVFSDGCFNTFKQKPVRKEQYEPVPQAPKSTPVSKSKPKKSPFSTTPIPEK